MKREKCQFRTVGLTPPNSGEFVYDEVWGYLLSEFFGASKDAENRWMITHIPSSLLLFDVRFATLDLCSKVVNVSLVVCPRVAWKKRNPTNSKLTSRFWRMRDALYEAYKSQPSLREAIVLQAWGPLLKTHGRGMLALLGDSNET